MEKLRVEKLKAGMMLAKTIYAVDGRVLVREKTEITASILQKLKELGLPAAYIETASQTLVEDLVSEQTRVDVISRLAKLENEVRTGHSLNLAANKQALYNLVDEVVSNQKKFVSITDIRLHNDYICGHSVNVATISAKIGLQLGFNQLKLAELAVGALFHDIGMAKVPVETLDKKGNLTAEELKLIRTHPEMGYNMLRQTSDVSTVSAHVAYQHHERYDGTGYPRGLTGDAIHEFGRIAAVADVFDSLTTEKVYRHAVSVVDTLKIIKSKAGADFDPSVVEILEQVVS